jgi:hypothetical protein
MASPQIVENTPSLTIAFGGSEAVIRWSIVPTACLQLQTIACLDIVELQHTTYVFSGLFYCRTGRAKNSK